jgi:hypothetical protein
MKVDQLRTLLEAAEDLHREGGNPRAADALRSVAGLCAGREAMTVAAFAKLIESAMTADAVAP